MAKGSSQELTSEEVSEAVLTLRFLEGEAERGEIPAADLGAALQGWDRFFQLAYFAYESSSLELPRQNTSYRVEFRVRHVGHGSVLVEALLHVARVGGDGIIAGIAFGGVVGLWKWSRSLVNAYTAAKKKSPTLDMAVDEIERLARSESIRVSRNRVDSEDFVTAIGTALSSATVALDSAAGREVLKLQGQPIDIVIDQDGREAIRTPFAPPELDPDADQIVEAYIRFIRINRRTGYGSFDFAFPKDESQFGRQRFRCLDRAIRQRANQYTGAFHQDVPLLVRMQRKAYEQGRHGHYWLIIGVGDAKVDDELALFKKRRRRKRDG